MLGVEAGVNHADNHAFACVGRCERGCARMHFVKAERLAAEVDSERTCPFCDVKLSVEAHAHHPFGGGHSFGPGCFNTGYDNAAVGLLHLGACGFEPLNGGVVRHFHQDCDLRRTLRRRGFGALCRRCRLQFQLVKMAERGLR